MRSALLFILLVATLFSYGQNDSLRFPTHQDASYQYKHRMDTLYFKEDAIKFAYAYNRGHSFSLGYNISRLDYWADVPTPTNRFGPTVSLGCLTRKDKLYFTPSVSYSGHFYFLYGNVDASYFTDFKNSSLFISPEVGISLIGLFYIGYSRQIAIFDNSNVALKNQLNIGCFAPLKKTRRLYHVTGKRAKYLDRK